ncbi:ATP-binding protein [Neptunomonas sp.]|uniref:ATP-binding protein n=1 Tax=Neptunomonas sp. TaxID=1971898 RepID=UPI0025D6D462|nr:ATP-binding protein [Neptunomonas sp.]
MARLFFTLYMGIIAALIGFLVLIEVFTTQLFYDFEEESTRRSLLAYVHLFEEVYELSGEEQMEASMLRTAKLESQILTVVTDASILERIEIKNMPDSSILLQSLEPDIDDGDVLYIRLSVNDKIYRSTNDTSSDFVKAAEILGQVYLWGFFLVTALTLAVWIYLLQRKLKMLESSSTAIANGDFSARAPMLAKHRVGGLNRSFNQMAERIEQLIASHKRLTNAVAHELRTPIFRLRCQLTMLEEDINSSSHQQFLQGMEEDLTELDQLVEELLSYAKMQRAGGGASFSAQIFLHWLLLQRPIMQRSCEKALRVLPGPSVEIEFDSRLLLRALSNLIRNADIHAKTQIELYSYIDSDYLVICIDDDGQGVPETDRERVFEPFERLDAARTRDTGGHGLGLSIVKEVMELHKGEVKVFTSPLGGARFALYLPLTSSSKT